MAWLKQVVQEKRDSVEGKMMVKAVAHPTTWHDEEDIVPCGAFRRSFIVLPSGDISACEKLIDVPEMTAGNIKLEILNEIWFGQRIYGLINPPFEKIDPTCQVCKNFEECRTGCYAIKYFQKINMYQKDPRCFLTNIV
jgi:pyrroloquinoline quinone biosynthesis protein E